MIVEDIIHYILGALELQHTDGKQSSSSQATNKSSYRKILKSVLANCTFPKVNNNLILRPVNVKTLISLTFYKAVHQIHRHRPLRKVHRKIIRLRRRTGVTSN